MTFTAEFIERRMREHRQWQEQEARRMAAEIAAEIRAQTFNRTTRAVLVRCSSRGRWERSPGQLPTSSA